MNDETHGNHGSEADRKSETVRTRWTPKPEQILILESIFNSGMVNPPKDETVRIRKHLEKFGSVGDANVFYWFQNRRSRSRRRQRQIQASLSGGEQAENAGAIQYENSSYQPYFHQMNASSCMMGSGSSSSTSCDGYYAYSGHHGLQEFDQSSAYGPSDTSSLHYQSVGAITVFINGVATEVGKGPVDMKAMFGSADFELFHSSGVPVQVNEYGFLVHSLHHGESYFLVPRHS